MQNTSGFFVIMFRSCFEILILVSYYIPVILLRLSVTQLQLRPHIL